MVPVIAYIRVSQVAGREGESFLSPELQRESIEWLAEREGLDVVEWIEELDASGGDSTRPGWNRALDSGLSVCVWNLSRFSRSVKDALDGLSRIEAAGGRLYSATEQFGDDPMGVFSRNMLLSIGQMERERAAVGFAAARSSALGRGVWLAGKIPLGYRKDENRRLVVDPDAAPVVQGLFERRDKGMSWNRLSAWSEEQGHPLSAKGVEYALTNRVYLGEQRDGETVKKDAHEAIVGRAIFGRVGVKGNRFGSRTGRLTNRYLLLGVATCGHCGSYLRLNSSGKGNDGYYCRNAKCAERAYANAGRLDSHVLNVIEERIDMADPSQWVARPGDDTAIEDAETLLAEAKADMAGFLADTRLRGILGADAYADAASSHVTVVNSAMAALEEARRAHTGSHDLLGHVWLQVWGHAERAEWLSKMVGSCEVSKGRGPMSGRVEVELR